MKRFMIAMVGMFLTVLLAHAETTVIKITDEVLVKDTIRLGINLGEDSEYSGATLTKMRAVENFEGILLRQCHFGPISAEDGMSTWFGGVGSDWDIFALSNDVVILSGPQQWERRKVVEVLEREFKQGSNTKSCRFFKFDKPIEPPPVNAGFMILGDNLDLGSAYPIHHWWNTASNKVVHGDVRPGGFGNSAYCIAGSEFPSSFYRMITHNHRYGDLNGTWKVRFWAKAVKADAELKVEGSVDRDTYPDKVSVTTEWTKFERSIVVSGIKDPVGDELWRTLSFMFKSATADILIDDIEIWQEEGDTNPTAFRDECVNTLKKYNPGILRNLQMGGSTIENMLSPRLRMRSFASQQGIKNTPYNRASRYSYSLPEFYELCEEINSEPWLCLPGTILPEELEQFLEYVSGSVDSKEGKRRAAGGHPKPWTETLSRIHVEFGNEAWNNAPAYQCGGYNGEDYWRDLIAKAKASPNYRSNIIFHSAGQAANAWGNDGIIKRTPNADCFSVGPYITHDLKEEDLTGWTDDDDLFRWAYGWTMDRSLSAEGSMVKNAAQAKAAGIELSIYEVNHHTTDGDAPLEPRNRLVDSLGGGLSVCNGMLLMLREQGIRNQGLFTFVQSHYRAKAGDVNLWGTALNMRKGIERYRPTFLAGEMANHVIGGDLVKTIQSTNQPMFTAKGRFENNKPNQSHTFPTIWSYAFKNGNRCGLILFNLDTSKTNQVKVEFAGKAQGGAVQYSLTADKIDANNEHENSEPQVKISETKLRKFNSGTIMKLQPHSMVVLDWRVR